jgi:XapX domain-containing protein
MKVYLVSLSLGLFVGAIYGFFGVRSPAPPVIALVGLFGMLLGEQIANWAQTHMFDASAITHIADHRSQPLVAKNSGGGRRDHKQEISQ